MIDFTFSVTEKEYLEAQKIFSREQNRKIFRWRWAMAAILLLSCFVVVLTTPAPLSSLTKIIPVLVVIAIMTIFLPQLQTRSFRKRFKLETKNVTNLHLTLDDDGYHADVPGVGAGVAHWQSMEQWFEGNTVFVIRSGLLMRVIPKTSLSGTQLQEVRFMLSAHIGPEGIKRTA